MIRTSMIALLLAQLLLPASASTSYLSWSRKEAQETGKSMRASGRVSGTGRGMFNTEKSLRYKIRATWFSREVIQASARLHQLQQRLSDEETEAIVSRAQQIPGIVFMIEIDPDEGSGIVPSDWGAYLQPKRSGKDGKAVAVAGVISPALRTEPAFKGVFARDYNYDVYWLVFPECATEGKPLFEAADREAELIVRIERKEGKVRFPIPESARSAVDCAP